MRPGLLLAPAEGFSRQQRLVMLAGIFKLFLLILGQFQCSLVTLWEGTIKYWNFFSSVFGLSLPVNEYSLWVIPSQKPSQCPAVEICIILIYVDAISVAECSLMWCSVARYSLEWCSIAQCSLMWCSEAQCSLVWCSVAHYSLVWCTVVQCSLMWCSVAQCNLLGAV